MHTYVDPQLIEEWPAINYLDPATSTILGNPLVARRALPRGPHRGSVAEIYVTVQLMSQVIILYLGVICTLCCRWCMKVRALCGLCGALHPALHNSHLFATHCAPKRRMEEKEGHMHADGGTPSSSGSRKTRR